jgi:hypothetical protein
MANYSQAEITRLIESKIKSPADLANGLDFSQFIPGLRMDFPELLKEMARGACLTIQAKGRPSSTKKLQAEIEALKAELAKRGQK